MPSTFPTVMLPAFKGLNKRDDEKRLNWGELVTATNVIINEDGSIERCNGYINLLASSLGNSPVTSLYEFERWDGSIEIFFEYEGTLYRLDPVTWTYYAIKSGLTSGAKIRYVSFNDYLYCGNGLNTNMKIVPTYRHYIDRDPITTSDASDLSSAIALVNDLKTDYEAHRQSTSQHNAEDTTNTITSANATDQASAITLANEIKSDYNAHRTQTGIHPSNDNYHLVEASDASDLSTLITLVNEIKLVYNQHIGDGRVLNWVVTAPSNACSASAVAGAGLEVGTYKYVFTNYNPIDGHESAPSPEVSVTTTSGNQQVDLSNIEQSTDPQVCQKRIYRTLVDGSIFYLIDTITNRTTTYSDTTADSDVGMALETEGIDTIPSSRMFTVYNGRIYISGDYANPYRIYFTEVNYPERYKPAYNYIDVDVSVTALFKCDIGVLASESNKLWLFSGSSPFTMSKYQISDTYGCTNQEGVAYIGSYPVIITNYGIKIWNGSNFEDLSVLINDDLLIKNLDSANIVYDAFNQKIYVIFANE